MAKYIIGFDLNKEGNTYWEAHRELTKAIRKLSERVERISRSTWLVLDVESNKKEIEEYLFKVLDEDDIFFIVRADEYLWHFRGNYGDSND